jgi:DNA-directed RNA polymerase subunit K
MESLTKYELARLLGARATQLANGALSTVDTKGLIDPLLIAQKELDEQKIPIIVVRPLPNGEKVEVRLGKLD